MLPPSDGIHLLAGTAARVRPWITAGSDSCAPRPLGLGEPGPRF
jgi:hypothetical protein